MNILEKRNSKNIRPGTFKMYLKTPCGQLLVSKVLARLKKTEQYKNLTKVEWKRIVRIVYRKNPNIHKIKKGG